MNYLEEYKKLRASLPRAALAHVNNENCDFCNYIDRSRDCYLSSNILENDKTFYSRRMFYCSHCLDCNYMSKSELCYQCVDCKNCYNCAYIQDCEQCSDCRYCLNLKGCKNCVGCINLRQKQFCIFNQQNTEKEFKKNLKNLTEEEINDKFLELKLKMPHTSLIEENNINSTGNHLFNNKNVHHCFEANECEDCGYSKELYQCKDCFDILVGEFSELNYDCVSAYHLNNSNFTYNCWESSDLEYCEQCQGCSDCLFCVNLYHKKFYILNKFYEREEYFNKKTQIIKELKKNGNYGKWIASTYQLEDSLATAKI